MSTTGLFDTTAQEATLWLKASMERLHTDDRHHAHLAFRAILHGLRDRLGPANAADLSAQLPMLVRGLDFEGWQMTGTPIKPRPRSDFFDPLRRELPKGSAIDPDLADRAVFGVLWEKLDVGEIGNVIDRLPADLQELWR